MKKSTTSSPMRMSRRQRRREENDDTNMEHSESKMVDQRPMGGKKEHCVELLADGNILAFVDFFYLTHRPPLTREEGGTMENAEKEVASIRTPLTSAFDLVEGGVEPESTSGIGGVSSLEKDGWVMGPIDALKAAGEDGEVHLEESELEYLRDALSEVERLRRGGEAGGVRVALENLARHFFGLGDVRTAAFFLSRALDAARTCGDSAAELEIVRAMGQSSEALGDLEEATRAYERVAETAEATSQESEARAARARLSMVLMRRGEESMKSFVGGEEGDGMFSGDGAAIGARLFLEAAAEASKAGDSSKRARALLMAGKACVAAGRPGDAVSHLREYLSLASAECDAAEEAAKVAMEAAEESDEDATLERLRQAMLHRDRAESRLGAGYGALAQALQAQNRPDEAADALRTFLERAATSTSSASSSSSSSSSSSAAQVRAAASAALAALLASAHDSGGAQAAMRDAFDLERDAMGLGLCGSGPVDRARAELGVAAGTTRATALMHAVRGNLPLLLQWKNARDVAALVDAAVSAE